jgi:hypothetical protein
VVDPVICDKCWKEFQRELNPVADVSRSRRQAWLCVLPDRDALINIGTELPEGCVMRFEQLVSAVMSK